MVADMTDRHFSLEKDKWIHYQIGIPKGNKIKGKILFIHGFMANLHAFDLMYKKILEDGYICVGIDLPGYGSSLHDPKYYGNRQKEKIIFKLLAYVDRTILQNPKQWYIVGHSMGCSTALEYACNHEVKKVFLISPALCPTLNLNWLKSYGSTIIEMLIHCCLTRMCLRRSRSSDKDKFFEQFRKQYQTSEGLLITLTDGMTITDPSKVESMLDKVMYLIGDRDEILWPKQKREIQRLELSGNVVKDGDHVLNYSHPNLVASIILAFFDLK